MKGGWGSKEDRGEDKGARSGRNLGIMVTIIKYIERKMKPMDQKTARVKRNMKNGVLWQLSHT